MEGTAHILQLDVVQFQGFLLILARFTGLFISAPLVSNPNVPKLIKIGLSIILSLLVFPFVDKTHVVVSNNVHLGILVLQEGIIGVYIGFLISLIFLAVQLGGQYIDYQSGFGLVNVIDPQSNVQVPLGGQFLFILASLLFFVIQGHHFVIQALIESFQAFPLAAPSIQGSLVGLLNNIFAKVIVISFKISAPVVGAVFIAEMLYGVLARAIPQLNILIVGLPLKIGIGTFFLMLIIPFFFWVMKNEFRNIFFSIQNLSNVM
jgi:flagellar biosynthetic protein FliR